MLRKLTTITAALTVAVFVLSALAQTPPKKKKKKHKGKRPAATAVVDAGTSDSDLYKGAPAAESEPAPTPPPADTSASASTEDAGAPSTEGESSESKPASSDNSGALPPVSIAALAGDGTNAAAGLGFGLRAGYTLPFHGYIGAMFVYHLGESVDGATANFYYPGGEVGYELTLGPILVRPYVGVGALALHESGGGQSLSRMYFAAWPGAVAAYSISPSFFIGVDGQYLLSSYSFAGIFGTVGARF